MTAYTESNSTWKGLFLGSKRPRTQLDQEIAASQQAVLVNTSLLTCAVNFVNATIIMYFFFSTSIQWAMLTWYLGLMAYSALSFRLWYRYRGTVRPRSVSGRLLAKAEIISISTGAAWGLLHFLIVDMSDDMFMFMALVCVGTAAALSSIFSQLPRMTARFSVATVAPIILSSIMLGMELAAPITVLGVFLVLLLIRSNIDSFEHLSGLIATRTEAQKARADLVDAIESVDDAFAIYDSSARLKLSNSRFREWFPKDVPLSLESDGRERMIGNGRWVLSSVEKVNDGGYVAIHTDISALKNRERELIVARREAEEASAAKDRFLATMSHELRAPLNLINGFSRLLTSDSRIAMTKDEIAGYGDQIHRAGKHLQTVVNDIIEFSDVGAQAQAYHPEVLNVRDVIERAASLAAAFQGLSDTRGIEIDVEPELGAIVADGKAIQRILMNLISNAIRYGSDPVRVIIRGCLRPDGAPLVTVRDFGYGLTADELSQVFEPFYQCARNRNGEFSGTGLGLTISRELARMHDGDVLLSSRLQGGTTATLVLPPKAHVANSDLKTPEAAEPTTGGRQAVG